MGDSPFELLQFDLEASGDGSGFPDYLVELRGHWEGFSRPAEYPYFNIKPSLQAINPDAAQAQGIVAIHRTGKVDWNNPDRKLTQPFRVFLSSFGVDAINDNTSYNTRQEFIERLVDWLLENPNIEVVVTKLPNLTAQIEVKVAIGITVAKYHYDIGDGAGYSITTSNALINQTYSDYGTYVIKVAIKTSFGHMYFAEPVSVTFTAPVKPKDDGCGCFVSMYGDSNPSAELLMLFFIFFVLVWISRRRN